MFFKISSQDKVDFTKNLAIMLKSGLAIDEALTALAEQAKTKNFAKLLTKVKNDIEYGTKMSDAFAKEEAIFGHIFVSMIRAGETSGTMEENLTFLAAWLERDHDLSNEVKGAAFYPKFVISATVILGGMLAVYILPKLTPLFGQLSVKLPLSTRILLVASGFISNYWLLTAVGMLLAVIAIRFIARWQPIQKINHWIVLRLPVAGAIVTNYQLAMFCQLLSTLVHGGLSLIEVMAVTGRAMSNLSYRQSVEVMKRRVSRGTKLSDAMKEFPRLYPKSLINIVSTGERSGTLENSLGYLAEFYSKEVTSQTKKLPTLIEPILLVFIAAGVLFVALSILMPIYSLTQGLGGGQ